MFNYRWDTSVKIWHTITMKTIAFHQTLSFSLFSNPSCHSFLLLFFFFLLDGWFKVNFNPKITPPSCFFFYPNWISDFTYFQFSFVCFCDFVVSARLCLFWFPFWYSVYLIQVGRLLALNKIRSMTLASSTL